MTKWIISRCESSINGLIEESKQVRRQYNRWWNENIVSDVGPDHPDFGDQGRGEGIFVFIGVLTVMVRSSVFWYFVLWLVFSS